MMTYETQETIIASRMTTTRGRVFLLRREPSEHDSGPAFGIRCEIGLHRDGLWWQREDHARSVFAAAI
jgi:hypothetical protein